MADSVPSWVTLTDDERLVWHGHPSIWLEGRWIVLGLVLVALGIGGAALLSDLLRLLSVAVIVIGLLFIVVPPLLMHRRIHYVITSEEVYKKTGLFSQNVTTLRLDSVQNTSFTQSFLARLMRYGDIRIETAGSSETEIVFDAVPNPKQVNGVLTESLDTVGQRST